MAEAPINSDLILRGRIARRPVTFVGNFEAGRLVELSGCVTLDVKLSSVLDDLREKHGEAGTLLQQLVGSGDIVLEKLGAAYRSGGKPSQGKPDEGGSVQVGLIIKVGDDSVQFALVKGTGSQKGFVVGVELCVDKTMPNNVLSGILGEISIGHLGVYYSSETFDDLPWFDAVGFQDATRLPRKTSRLASRTFPQGVKVSVDIVVGGVHLLEQLAKLPPEATPPDKPKTPVAQGQVGSGKEMLAKGMTHWFETNKAIGPLTIRRVGLGYEAPRVVIKLDARLRLTVLNLSLEGLGLSYPINEFSTKPHDIWDRLKFHLDGASVAFSGGLLTIGGGLIKVEDPKHPDRLQLDGFLLIRTNLFAVTALGSYADMGGTPSLFAFAALQKELGGPAFFFVTGLAVGFGINRALQLPAINEVHNFPLVKAATDPDYLAKNLDLRRISERLAEYVYPSQGNFWVAAGVKFNSFGQIDSFAMLSVLFGTQVEIALIGLSRIRVPKLLPGMREEDVPAIVCAEMAFKIALTPASGVLSVEARLTENSFVLRKDFKLRGGFAFYSWFAGEHEGDFVVSIGGYHPRFKAPAHYPKPDLVEFVCRIGDHVAIRGHCYFAFCPAAIMAGGGLSVVYQLGGIRAWFIAQADFLVQWKPLYYDIAIGVSVGVSLRIVIGVIRISLSVELSAALQLHGPPLGGIARISLWIVTIEVKFGDAKRTPPPLLWESGDSEKSFAKAFLPNPKVTTLTITDGLLKEHQQGEATLSFVAPQKLVLNALTLVPATAVRFNGEPPKDKDGKLMEIPQPKVNDRATQLGVRPMGKSAMYSLIEITLEPSGDASEAVTKYLSQYIETSLVTKSVPCALWGGPIADADKRKPPAATEQLVDSVLMGIEIKTKAGPRPWETPALDLSVLAYDRFPKPFDWVTPKPADALGGFGDKTIAKTVAAVDVSALRRSIVKELADSGRRIMQPDEIHLDRLASHAEYIFQDMPAMARVGQYPPRGYLQT